MKQAVRNTPIEERQARGCLDDESFGYHTSLRYAGTGLHKFLKSRRSGEQGGCVAGRDRSPLGFRSISDDGRARTPDRARPFCVIV